MGRGKGSRKKCGAGPLDRERALREITRALASDLNEEHILELAIHHAEHLIGVPCARVWLVDDERVSLRCVASTDYLRPRLLGERLPLDSLTGEVAVRGLRMLNLADATLHPSWRDPDFKARTGLGAYLTAAIMRAGTSLGVLQVIREVDRPFSEDDELLVCGLADALAVAVGNARLYRQAQDEIAERARTEAALRESEETYRQMFEGNQAVKLLIDPSNGAIVDANGAACAFYGYPRAELLTLSINDINQLPLAEVQAELERTERQQRSYFVFRHRVATGAVRDVEVHSGPIDVGGRRLLFSIIHDITQRKQAEAELQYLARYDALTGLPNRTLFHELVQQTLLAGRVVDTLPALLLMDLDRFKEVNDTFGHHYGDRLIQEVAGWLQTTVASACGDSGNHASVVARLGGDEFAVLLPSTTRTEALRIARRLVDALARPFQLDAVSAEVGCSVGVALGGDSSDDADILLRHADVAMYLAKRSGRGVELYTSEQDPHCPSRLGLLGDLRTAIERQELRLHFQPQLDLRSRRITGAEALVRWQHPLRGLVPPDQFVGLAEHAGLIKPVTGWVLQAAARTWYQLRGQGSDLSLSVNVSARDLHDPELATRVGELLSSEHLSPDALRVEVTESAVMLDSEQAIRTLSELRARGIGVSIDDFGTGYSSFAYLKDLPADELKIDRAFIRQIATKGTHAAIVKAAIGLGHDLGMRVVAEGVEDVASLHRLSELDCDLAQGFYISRPLPANEFATWLAAAARAEGAFPGNQAA